MDILKFLHRQGKKRQQKMPEFNVNKTLRKAKRRHKKLMKKK